MSIEEKLEPIFESFEPAREHEIDRFEKQYNIEFFKDHRSFLMKYGRCMFSGETTVVSECGSSSEVSSMFGIYSDAGDIGFDLDLHPDYIENKYLPIADDSFNNRYVIDSSGRVLFLDYSNFECVIKLVALSFSEFLEKIEVEPYE